MDSVSYAVGWLEPCYFNLYLFTFRKNKNIVFTNSYYFCCVPFDVLTIINRYSDIEGQLIVMILKRSEVLSTVFIFYDFQASLWTIICNVHLR